MDYVAGAAVVWRATLSNLSRASRECSPLASGPREGAQDMTTRLRRNIEWLSLTVNVTLLVSAMRSLPATLALRAHLKPRAAAPRPSQSSGP